MDRTIPNKTGLSSLPTIENRISFLYLEYCHISQEDGALVASDKAGSINIPSSAVGALLLGPGTTVTHKVFPAYAGIVLYVEIEGFEPDEFSPHTRG